MYVYICILLGLSNRLNYHMGRSMTYIYIYIYMYICVYMIYIYINMYMKYVLVYRAMQYRLEGYIWRLHGFIPDDTSDNQLTVVSICHNLDLPPMTSSHNRINTLSTLSLLNFFSSRSPVKNKCSPKIHPEN